MGAEWKRGGSLPAFLRPAAAAALCAGAQICVLRRLPEASEYVRAMGEAFSGAFSRGLALPQTQGEAEDAAERVRAAVGAAEAAAERMFAALAAKRAAEARAVAEEKEARRAEAEEAAEAMAAAVAEVKVCALRTSPLSLSRLLSPGAADSVNDGHTRTDTKKLTRAPISASLC